MKCPACTWVTVDDPTAGTARAQLEQHADEAEHPRCAGCRRILLTDEAQTCGDWPGARQPGEATCVDRGHELVSGILASWVDLHGEPRQWPRSAMLGPGGRGDMPRPLLPSERTRLEQWWLTDRIGPLSRLDWQRLEAQRTGKEHLADNLISDPPVIDYELIRWQDDWRQARGEQPLLTGGHRAFREAATYLETQMRWAARNHPAFADFLTEMTQLHARCQAAVGRAPVKPEQLDVECLDCGTLLQHPLVEVTEEKDGRRWSGPAIDKRARVCPRCGSRYDDDENDEPSIRWKSAQAEAASRRASRVIDGETWQQITRVAHDLGRNRQTVWTWVRAGDLRSFEQKGQVFVPVEEATALHRDRPMRKTSRAS